MCCRTRMLARRSPNVFWSDSASWSCASVIRSAFKRISPSSCLATGGDLLDGDAGHAPLAPPQGRELELRPDTGARQLVAELGRVGQRHAAHGGDDVSGLDA